MHERLLFAASMLLLADRAWCANDGAAQKPIMGWRSWNQWQSNADQRVMEASFDALVDRSRTVNGVPASLRDVGYSDAGIDDAWQLCGRYGPDNYTYHDGVTGAPVVDTKKFPSLKNMTDHAHRVNLTAGW